MIDRSFHVFVRQHAAGVSVALLGHPHLCAVAGDLTSARRDLAVVVGRLLRRGELPSQSSPLPDARLRRVDVVVRALQKGRILSVPMRFSVVTHGERQRGAGARGRAGARAGALRVLVPRLELEGELDDTADLAVYVEEIVRHHLHLEPLGRLLEVAYAGEETLDTLLVSYAPPPEAERKRPAERRARPALPPALGEACRRLDDEREAGLLARAYGRDVEVAHVAALLNARARSSVLLVGETSVGKTCLVHELAHRAADAASPLAGLEIYSTSAGRIIAGMRYLGEWQDRLQRMVAELRQRPAVLHFDSLGELLSIGGAGDTLDLSRFLLPAIESGDVTMLVEARPEELIRAERAHGPFLRALRTVTLEPLSSTVAREALAQVAARLGAKHQARFEPPALDRAMDLSQRFGAGALPGAAADLLSAAAQAQVPGRRSATRAPRPIDARAVTAAFCARTGYPVALVDPAVPLDPAAVLQRLRARVMGQDGAMELLAHLVVTLKTNLADPRKPLGSFLLLGPTGVGKTESALALAELLFGDDRRVGRFDMAEYAALGSAARLVDARASGATLAKRVREQPFGVVLLDEIEKADGGVLDLLLQVLGEGRLTDSVGQTVGFRNTVVIMTSNLGADTAGRAVGFGDGGATAAEAHYRAAAAAFFRPELLNRFDQIVPYRPLDRDVIASLARRMLDAAIAREGIGRRAVDVRYDDAVVDRLVALGFDARLGARPLKRAVEQHVVVPIAELLSGVGRRPASIALRVTSDGRIVAEPRTEL
jgi:ATP-dependent Clp protease ATP-binding subunit ClpC